MRRLVLKVVLHLGRYTVLPVMALAGALLLAWLMALDRYTVANAEGSQLQGGRGGRAGLVGDLEGARSRVCPIRANPHDR